MNKLLQTRTGDTFPIYVGEGIEVLIEDQLVFQSELGELSGQAAVNIKKRLSK
jgi:flagellar motor switch protein FliM